MNNEFPAITLCKDEKKLMDFLYKIDATLPVPLSARTDLARYGKKHLENSLILAIEQENELACAAIFYYHFEDRPAAYLDLMATAPGHTGKGYAKQVMDAMEAAAREAGMTEFHLHTNESNTAARALYSKRGYEIIQTEPKLQMRKFL